MMRMRSAVVTLLLATAGCSGGQTLTSPSLTTNQETSITDVSNGATITFDGFASNQPFSTAIQSGFTIDVTQGSWIALPPAIQFRADRGQTVTGQIRISAGGSRFRFQAVDLYSSTTPIPYAVQAFQNFSTGSSSQSGLAFSASSVLDATVLGNTFGNYATVPSPDPSTFIAALVITLTNAAFPCCDNPMGLKNIVLAGSSSLVPR